MNKEKIGRLLNAIEDILSELSSSDDKKYVVFKDLEFLDREILIDIAKEHIVPGSNAIAVMKCTYQGKGRKILDLLFKKDVLDIVDPVSELVTEEMLSICYLSNDEIIEKHKNCFINIRTKHLSDDVRELFKDGDLVILQ